MRFLSNKQIIYGANVDEKQFSDVNQYVDIVKEHVHKLELMLLFFVQKRRRTYRNG